MDREKVIEGLDQIINDPFMKAKADYWVLVCSNALALLNKTYFRKGVCRRYEELEAMGRKPDHLCEMIDSVLAAATVKGLKDPGAEPFQRGRVR